MLLTLRLNTDFLILIVSEQVNFNPQLQWRAAVTAVQLKVQKWNNFVLERLKTKSILWKRLYCLCKFPAYTSRHFTSLTIIYIAASGLTGVIPSIWFNLSNVAPAASSSFLKVSLWKVSGVFVRIAGSAACTSVHGPRIRCESLKSPCLICETNFSRSQGTPRVINASVCALSCLNI